MSAFSHGGFVVLGMIFSVTVFEMVRKKFQLDVQRIEGSNLKNIKIAPNIYKIDLGS